LQVSQSRPLACPLKGLPIGWLTVSAGEVGAFGAIFYAAFGGENHTTALTGEEMQSPFGGWRHLYRSTVESIMRRLTFRFL
ncbi:hypothetical protein, partial [uncultured Dialister sp.]|uniref:hypothetical protein n=1 Tax=uncultured Dialister sp. TaxID=278064 RepID=UPI0027DCA21D